MTHATRAFRYTTCRERELTLDHIHTFLTTQGYGGPSRIRDQLNAGATSETTRTCKTIHTIHAPIRKLNMKARLWRSTTWSTSPDDGSAQCRGHLRDNTNMQDYTLHSRIHSFNQGEYERMIVVQREQNWKKKHLFFRKLSSSESILFFFALSTFSKTVKWMSLKLLTVRII